MATSRASATREPRSSAAPVAPWPVSSIRSRVPPTVPSVRASRPNCRASNSSAAECRGHPIDDGARHQRLADGRALGPLRTMLEQVADGDREIVVGIEQPGARYHDAVAVGIGVVAEGDLVGPA